MKQKITIYLSLLLLAFTILYIFPENMRAQVSETLSYPVFEPNNNYSFSQVRSSLENYWKNKPRAKGDGWKIFKRWEYFWGQRLDSAGKVPNMAKIYQNWQAYLAKDKQKKDKITGINPWTFLGPSSEPYKSILSSPEGVGMGRINCIAFDPNNQNIIWVGAAYGGVWKSTDGGMSWNTFPFTEFLSIGISDIAVSPSNPNIVYVATGDADGSLSPNVCYSIGILKTTDGGNTWAVTGFKNQIADGVIINKLLVHPSNPDTVYAATSKGLYNTFNGGATWNVRANAYFRDMEFKPGNTGIIYGAAILQNQQGNYVYGVLNCVLSQTNWTANFTFPITDVRRIAIAVTPANPNVIYALCAASDLGFHSFLKSNDGGATWSIIAQRNSSPNILNENFAGSGNGGQGNYDLCVAASRTDANLVYIGGVNIWKTTDGGSHWTLNAEWTGEHGVPWVHADQHSLEFSPANILFSTNDGGVNKTTNGGTNWIDLSNGLEVTQFYRLSSAPTSEGIIYCGSQDNGTHRLLAKSWKNVLGGDGMTCLVDPTNYNFVYTSLYYGDFWKSTDGGDHFAEMLNSSITQEQGGWVTPMVIDQKNPSILYAGYQNVWKSTNRGANWSKTGTVSDTNNNVVWSMAVAPSNSNYLYVTKMGGVWLSTNAGVNWTQIITGGLISSIVVDPNNPNRIWFTQSGYADSLKVYEYNGTLLKNISGSLPNVPVNSIVYQNNSPDRLYIGTDVGVFYRDNRMNDWQLFNEGMPNVVINQVDIQYASQKIRAATFGRGLWENDLIECNAPLPEIQAAKTDICEGDSVRLEVQDIYKSYLWSSGERTNYIYVKSAGNYYVTVTDSSDCVYSTTPISINIHSIPNISVNVTGNTTFCEGDSVILTGNPKFTFTKWEWSNGLTDRSITVKSSGIYRVTGTTSDSCVNTSDSVVIVVNPVPEKPTITRNGNILTASQALKYQWYRNNVPIQQATLQSLVMTRDGTYTVKVFNEFDCFSLSDPLDVILGIEDKEASNETVTLQPNPTPGTFTVVINSGVYSKASIEVSDLQGNKITYISEFEFTGSSRHDVDLRNYTAGVYLVKVYLNDEVIYKKIIKE